MGGAAGGWLGLACSGSIGKVPNGRLVNLALPCMIAEPLYQTDHAIGFNEPGNVMSHVVEHGVEPRSWVLHSQDPGDQSPG